MNFKYITDSKFVTAFTTIPYNTLSCPKLKESGSKHLPSCENYDLLMKENRYSAEIVYMKSIVSTGHDCY